MIGTVSSKNDVPIRLTDERWAHIVEEHGELAGMERDVLEAVAHPTRIVAGSGEELLAVREREPGKFLVVAYRETQTDGFVITAFLTRRMSSLSRRRQLWP